jgi:hypothetical protein
LAVRTLPGAQNKSSIVNPSFVFLGIMNSLCSIEAIPTSRKRRLFYLHSLVGTLLTLLRDALIREEVETVE